MRLILTEAGKKKLKEMSIKTIYGGASNEERRYGSLLDYIEIWQPIEDTDPIYGDEQNDFDVRRRIRGAFEAGHIEDLDK